MKCKKTCKHYHYYEMITNGPYGYCGDIPCLHCIRFNLDQDFYEPIEPTEVGNTEDNP